MKIGLTQRVVLEGHGERRDCLDQAWSRRLTALGYWPVPLPNCVEDAEGLLDALQLEGIILTGGNDLTTAPGGSNSAPERDAFEHRLIDSALKRRLPLLGVCRGLQILVTHYGGRLRLVDGHVGGTHPLRLEGHGRIPLGGREAVNTSHHYGIAAGDVGAGLEILATAPDGTVEAVAHREEPQWGIMWHPERPPSDARDVELLRGIFPREPG